MKKTMLLAAMAAFAMNMVFAGTITVSQPAGGSFAMGAVCPVHWTATGVAGNVKIQLIRPGGALVGLLVSGLAAGSSPWNWTVASPAVAGESYKVRVSNSDNSTLGVSATFSVTAAAASTITINNPPADCEWYRNSTHTIGWTKTGTMQNIVAIRLIKWGMTEADPGTVVIADNTPNDGSHSWPVPQSVATGDYFIRVRTMDSTVSDDSTGKVTIKKCTPQLHMDKPNGGEVWILNSTKDITWSWGNSCAFEGKVRLLLLRDGEVAGTIAEEVEGALGSYAWKVGQINALKSIAQLNTVFKVRVIKIDRSLRGLDLHISKGANQDVSDNVFTIRAGLDMHK